MEFFLNIQNLVLIIAVEAVIAACILLLLRQINKEITSFVVWIIAYLCFIFSYVFLGYRGEASNEISILLANGGFLIGYTFFYIGNCFYTNSPVNKKMIMAGLICFWGPFFFLYQDPANFSLRACLISLGVGYFCFLNAYPLYKASNKDVFAQKVISIVFFVNGLFHMAVAGWYIFKPTINNDLIGDNPLIGTMNSGYLFLTIVVSAGFILAYSPGFVIMVTERLRNELKNKMNEVTTAKKVVETSLKEQRNFFAMISHEFKTPLSTIDAAREIIGMNLPSSDNESKEEVDRIKRSSTRLSGLIDQLLVEDLLETTIALKTHDDIYLPLLLKDVCKEHGVEFQLVGDHAFQISGDPGLLRIVFSNLIENALKYGESKNSCRVRCYQDSQNNVIIEVEDAGVGIEPLEKELIYEKYYRSERAHKKQGGGLGLYFVKKILDLHGAQIENEKVNKLNVFRVSFQVGGAD